MGKVSIIIPVYNVALSLERCLDSVIAQTYPNLEIIIVNDGSPDNSSEIISRYAQQDTRIVVVNKINGGLSDARNAGMEKATGDYLCFLDGDDWYDQNFVEELYNRMISENYDLVCCDYRYTWDTGKTKDKFFLSGLPATLNNQEAIAAFLTQKILGSVDIKIFKHSICRENHLSFPEGILWEDLIFTLNYLFHTQKTGIIQKCLYNYYQGPESISRTEDTLNVLHFMQSAIICVKINEVENPGRFKDENRCFITRAFIAVLVYSFKCKNEQIKRTLLQEMKEQKGEISIKLLSPMEKLLIILYRINYSVTRLLFLNIYKKLQ